MVKTASALVADSQGCRDGGAAPGAVAAAAGKAELAVMLKAAALQSAEVVLLVLSIKVKLLGREVLTRAAWVEFAWKSGLLIRPASTGSSVPD